MNYIVDIVFLAFVVLIVFLSAKKGLVSTILDCLNLAVSAVAATYITPFVSDKVYSIFVKNAIQTKLNVIVNKEAFFQYDISEKINKLLGAFPSSAIRLCSRFGVNVNSLTKSLKSMNLVSQKDFTQAIMNKVAYPVMIFLIKIVVFAILFIVIALLIKLISKSLSKLISKIPLVGNINTFLGGVFGIIKACVFILVICTVLYFIVAGSGNKEFVSAIKASQIYGFVTKINPLLSYFK